MEFAFDGSNPDVGLLETINGLVGSVPHWADGAVRFLGEYGLLLAVLGLLAHTWWTWARRRGADVVPAVAGVAWAGLAGLLALALSVPIRHVVHRPRPFAGQRGLHVLLRDTSRFSFVSDHSTLAMAVGVGLFMVNRRVGLAGMALALVQGFTRVLMGDNYPTDVIGGFALGTATALLLAPLAMLGLTPLVRAVERGRAAVLVRAVPPTPALAPAGAAVGGEAGSAADVGASDPAVVEHSGPADVDDPATPPCDKDLAA
jgi:undecaprenyl-diphosphatase